MKPGTSGGEFEGYSNPDQSETKILRNVFEPGDAWYRTGDLMTSRCEWLLLFHRSCRRHIPVEGRERGDLGSRRRDHGLP